MNSTPSSLRRILLQFSFFLFLVLAGVAGRPVFSQQQPSAPNAPQRTSAKQRLSPKDRKEVFEKVWKEIRDHYYDSNLNGVDWNEVHQRYLPLVDAVKSDQDFYVLISQMTRARRSNGRISGGSKASPWASASMTWTEKPS